MTIKKIAVLGAGSWGSALAMLLCQKGHDVILWGKNSTEMAAMQEKRCNVTYLPNLIFPDNLKLTSDLAEAVANVDDILLVIPSHVYAEFLPKLKPLLNKKIGIATASKGFCNGKCLHKAIEEYLPNHLIAVISGPSFAGEVAEGLPTAIVVASENESYADKWINYLSSDRFRPYKSADVIGVEIGGSVKNVLAIATGIASGLKMGSNAQAAIITRGLAEIARLGVAMGAQAETFMGLAGLGDLVLTATDSQSRNRRFGYAIGSGKTAEQAQTEIGQVVEGVFATQEVHELAKKYHVEMPIVEQVYNVLFNHLSPKVAAKELLGRDLKAE